jgi:hypothetical protein
MVNCQRVTPRSWITTNYTNSPTIIPDLLLPRTLGHNTLISLVADDSGYWGCLNTPLTKVKVVKYPIEFKKNPYQ